MYNSNRRPISEDEFMEVAEIASKSNCLKQREGKFGTDWAIVLNGHIMMMAIVNEDDEREYFSLM